MFTYEMPWNYIYGCLDLDIALNMDMGLDIGMGIDTGRGRSIGVGTGLSIDADICKENLIVVIWLYFLGTRIFVCKLSLKHPLADRQAKIVSADMCYPVRPRTLPVN